MTQFINIGKNPEFFFSVSGYLFKLITVDSRKLGLSGDQKNNSSYREFEFSRNGIETMKITGLLS